MPIIASAWVRPLVHDVQLGCVSRGLGESFFSFFSASSALLRNLQVSNVCPTMLQWAHAIPPCGHSFLKCLRLPQHRQRIRGCFVWGPPALLAAAPPRWGPWRGCLPLPVSLAFRGEREALRPLRLLDLELLLSLLELGSLVRGATGASLAGAAASAGAAAATRFSLICSAEGGPPPKPLAPCFAIAHQSGG